mmetsp:Transcript_3512/g.10852  ORF Transcript_3512/g.10852 Transcript_3512/m.10852 type:complete len:384 (+) Transcript_3512:848-1999(+)
MPRGPVLLRLRGQLLRPPLRHDRGPERPGRVLRQRGLHGDLLRLSVHGRLHDAERLLRRQRPRAHVRPAAGRLQHGRVDAIRRARGGGRGRRDEHRVLQQEGAVQVHGLALRLHALGDGPELWVHAARRRHERGLPLRPVVARAVLHPPRLPDARALRHLRHGAAPQLDAVPLAGRGGGGRARRAAPQHSLPPTGPVPRRPRGRRPGEAGRGRDGARQARAERRAQGRGVRAAPRAGRVARGDAQGPEGRARGRRAAAPRDGVGRPAAAPPRDDGARAPRHRRVEPPAQARRLGQGPLRPHAPAPRDARGRGGRGRGRKRRRDRGHRRRRQGARPRAPRHHRRRARARRGPLARGDRRKEAVRHPAPRHGHRGGGLRGVVARG